MSIVSVQTVLEYTIYENFSSNTKAELAVCKSRDNGRIGTNIDN